MIATVGNIGDKVRSDCFIKLELKKSGGIQLKLQSKVGFLFEDSIRKLCHNILNFFKIKDAELEITDKGALPFVIAARMEAAIKMLIKTDKNFLLEILPENLQVSPPDRNWFSRLYLPGNSPAMMLNAGIHNPSAIILDLEDSVAPERKPEARLLVRNALRSHSFLGAERMVRINPVPFGLDDLEDIIPHAVHTILVPKVESAEQITCVNDRIRTIFRKTGQTGYVRLIPIIETALGVMKAFEIAQAADNIVAMTIGLEDYTADIDAQRTYEGKESAFAKGMVLNACKAAGIQALDSVFSDVSDMEALKKYALNSKAIGYDGMGCIHPRQLKIINESFAPSEYEIDQAKKIVTAYNEASKNGFGVVALGTKMIDLPVVKRAEKIMNLAIQTGKVNPDWINPSLDK
ncbi:MAG: aldolase/citrate lyase family protein [Lentimicrobiaceae bacterium]|nr:aldolase/citrate lyase family protein [Lentimicrobiaceae bacterium]